MGLQIAAILHKLHTGFVLKCSFSHIQPSLLMKWQCHFIYSVPLLSFLTSLLPDPPISLSFSLSLSLSSPCFVSVGTRNEQLPCSDWMMYEVIRWDESVHNSKDLKWQRREREYSAGGETLKCFDKQLWKREDEESCRCLPVTMRVGHSFTDFTQPWHTSFGKLSQRSSSCIFHRSCAPCASLKKAGRLRSALGCSLGGMREGTGAV